MAGGVLGIATILSGILPVRADEAQSQAPAAAPAISPWSVQTLLEGEKYGIFPLSWYYDGTFQQPIGPDKFRSLIQATAAKLDALELPKKASAPSAEKTESITRETVLRSLYDTLTRYDLPETFGIGKDSPIDYLQKKGIVEGTDRGLELETPSTVEQAAVLASRLVEYAYETADAGAKGLLWKVTKGNNTLYMLGSIHLGIPDMYPMRESVKDAFESADALFVEANLASGDPADMAYFQQQTMYDDGTTLKDHVSAQTYEKLQQAAGKLNLPVQAFDAYKPWAVTNNLSLFTLMDSPEDITQAATLGVDMYFLHKAILTGKPIQELEGVKFQGDLLSNVPPEEQEKELNQLLDTIVTPAADAPNPAKQFKQWQLLWADGDLDGFTKSYSESLQSVPNGSMQRLLGERDKNMAKKLSDLLEKEGEATYFVVVGAAHYATKGMVIDLLKQQGYDVQFVP